MTQTVFSRYHTEHEMLRYLRRLADKDLALDRTMIPLGSCTMKLNATVEMEPLTWPGLADMHPFTPEEATVGIREMIAQLESMLVAITGYDAVSLQPNAGSQGEFAGLLAIHAYHRSRGEAGRNVCLIPSSAHGTNAASAVMAGLKVVVVRCDDRRQHRSRRSRGQGDGCRRFAGRGDGHLSVDAWGVRGAHQRAVRDRAPSRRPGVRRRSKPQRDGRVGPARQVRRRRQPSQLAQDVLHPPRRRGPGVGPVAVRAHLAEFLPAHPLSSAGRPVGAVAAAPFGSASILSISWVYIALMGASGLTDASAMAILNANYIATRLDPYFPVLYTGDHGRVAHECIIDLRPITKATGVTVDDVAKRLIDFGFHAPTMSFPVTRHVDDRADRERIAVRARSILCGDDRHQGRDRRRRVRHVELASSPLRYAPHTAEDLIGDWKRPYDRQLGAYPVAALRAAKYFPPVSRIDAAYRRSQPGVQL